MNYPPELRLVALDLASVAGWCLLASGKLTSGSQDFRRARSQAHPGIPLAQFDNWLAERLPHWNPKLVIYENAGFFRSADAAQICIGLRGILLSATAKRNLPVVAYSPSAIKKFFTGNGRAEKPQMVAEFRRRWPDLAVVDHNQIDAVAMLHFHLAKIGIEELELLRINE